MDKPIFFANWKMNMGLSAVKSYIQTIIKKVPEKEQSRFVFLSPALLLPLLQDMLQASAFGYGGQNCHFEDRGAWTGENSPLVLKELGATHCLVGHSERRQLFFESNSLVQKKTKSLMKHGIQPIVCVGETAKEHEQGQTFKVLEKQIRPILEIFMPNSKALSERGTCHEGTSPVRGTHGTDIYVAYEPVWAIGTGRPATVKGVAQVCMYVQELFKSQGLKCRCLYGGSVNAQNTPAFSEVLDLSGFLVGGASLNPHTFLNLYPRGTALP